MDEEIEVEPDFPLFPPVEVDMVVDESPIILSNDDNNEDTNLAAPESLKNILDYKEEILNCGLVESDFDYLIKAYKNLEEVKFIKIHCTGCDKHMGSSPNDLNNRYQHPILKVLMCINCYHFYCSGEFEKGEDGSELYCRWCGEGGLVYCCTKCPFVFCKNCITRNLGRGTARIIENTEHWICFSCNPWQINRHRATYWAIQKFSEEMIAHSKITGDITMLDVDSNICCQGKKRAEPCEKSRAPISKKPKVMKLSLDAASNTLLQNALQNTPSTSKGKKSSSNNISLWQNLPLSNVGPEDEVICTPDIIPIDESPPSSPLLTTPPPLIPYVVQQQSLSKLKVQQTITPRPRIQPVNIRNLQKNLQTSFQKNVVLTSQLLTTNNSQIVVACSSPVNVKLGALNQEGLRIVHHPATVQTVQQNNETSKLTKDVSTEPENNDWFDKAIVECAEVTEYVSTKISGLAGVHSRAHKSEKLMGELHNTLQTYIHVAIDKMKNIKRNMQTNYERERENPVKMLNPFAKKKKKTKTKKSRRSINALDEDSSSSPDTQSASEDESYTPKEEDYSSEDSYSSMNSLETSKGRRKLVPKLELQIQQQQPYQQQYEDQQKQQLQIHYQQKQKAQQIPDDVDLFFDMDVTNASDEEMDSRAASSIGSNNIFQTEEIINIISSDDDDVEEILNNDDSNSTLNREDENKEETDANTDITLTEEETNSIKEDTTIVEKAIEEDKLIVEKAIEEDKLIVEKAIEEDKLIVEKAIEEDKLIVVEADEDKTIVKDDVATKEEDKTIDVKSSAHEDKLSEHQEEKLPEMKIKTEETISKLPLPETLDELVKRVESKFNIQNISSKDLLNYLSPKVILYNNRRAKKEFIDAAVTSSKIEKEFNLVKIIQNTLNTEMREFDNNFKSTKLEDNDKEETEKTYSNNDVDMGEPCDVEEMLGSSVVLRPKKSFGDEFSRFIGKSSESESRNVNSADEISDIDDEVNDISNNGKTDKNDKISDDSELDEAELFFNKDNESLSLPPDGIGDTIATNNIFATKEPESSDLVLDSGILALKQMAENCVNPTVELRQASTECNG